MVKINKYMETKNK